MKYLVRRKAANLCQPDAPGTAILTIRILVLVIVYGVLALALPHDLDLATLLGVVAAGGYVAARIAREVTGPVTR